MVFKHHHPPFQQSNLWIPVLLFFYFLLLSEKAEVLAMDIASVRAGVNMDGAAWASNSKSDTVYFTPGKSYQVVVMQEPDISSVPKRGLHQRKKPTADPVGDFPPHQNIPSPSRFQNRPPRSPNSFTKLLKKFQFFLNRLLAHFGNFIRKFTPGKRKYTRLPDYSEGKYSGGFSHVSPETETTPLIPSANLNDKWLLSETSSSSGSEHGIHETPDPETANTHPNPTEPPIHETPNPETANTHPNPIQSPIQETPKANPLIRPSSPPSPNRIQQEKEAALKILKDLPFVADHTPRDPKSFKDIALLPGYVKTNDYIAGDGNCLFRAIAFYRDGNQEGHAAVRSEMVDFIKKNPEMIKDALGFKYRGVEINTVQQYCDLMSIPGVWGDEYSVIALSSLYKFNIALVSETDRSIWAELTKWKPVDNHNKVDLNAELPDDNKVHWVGLYLTDSHYELLYRESDKTETLEEARSALGGSSTSGLPEANLGRRVGEAQASEAEG